MWSQSSSARYEPRSKGSAGEQLWLHRHFRRDHHYPTLQSACCSRRHRLNAVRPLANDGGLRHAAGVEEWEIRVEAHRNLVHIKEDQDWQGESGSSESGEGAPASN